METQNATPFVPIERVAVKLGVPASWLKSEAAAGRLPVLRAGRRLLMNVEVVRQSLSERSQGVAHA